MLSVSSYSPAAGGVVNADSWNAQTSQLLLEFTQNVALDTAGNITLVDESCQSADTVYHVQNGQVNLGPRKAGFHSDVVYVNVNNEQGLVAGRSVVWRTLECVTMFVCCVSLRI